MSIILGVICVSAMAAAAEAPTLTETERLRVVVAAQAVEIAQLRAQTAQHDLEAASTKFRTLIQSLQRDGYTFDLQTLTYTPTEKKGATP